MRLVLRTAGEGCVLLAQPLAPDRHPALCKAASRTGQCIGIASAPARHPGTHVRHAGGCCAVRPRNNVGWPVPRAPLPVAHADRAAPAPARHARRRRRWRRAVSSSVAALGHRQRAAAMPADGARACPRQARVRAALGVARARNRLPGLHDRRGARRQLLRLTQGLQRIVEVEIRRLPAGLCGVLVRHLVAAPLAAPSSGSAASTALKSRAAGARRPRRSKACAR